MSRDLAEITAAPRTFTYGGDEYVVHKLRPRDLGEISAWLMDRTPNPKAEARKVIEGLTDAVAIHIWDQAVEEARDWPPTLDSPKGQAFLSTPDGQSFLVWVALRRSIPGFDRDRARDLSEKLTGEDFSRLMSLVNPGEPGDPKATGPAA
jgi:hypothetical protein